MAGRGVIREPAFRTLLIAKTVSFLGDGATRTALVLLTAGRGASAVATVLLADALPRFLGPVGGALADRWDRRRLMQVSSAGQALAIAAVAVTLPSTPVLAALVAAQALLATAFNPASSSAMPQIVDRERLPRAYSLMESSFNVQIAAGPALGGLLVGLGGSRTAFAADAATFVAAAILLGRLPPLRPDAPASARIWASTRDGLAYVSRSPALRLFFAGTTVFVAFAAIDNVALVFLVRGPLGGSTTAYGFVQAGFGVGMLVASIGLAAVRRAPAASSLLIAGAASTVVGSALTAVAPTLLAAGGAQAVAGAGNGAENVASSTYIQQLVPAPMLGRVFGAYGTAAQVGGSVAYVLGAPIVAGVGARTAFAIAAAGAAAGLILLIAAFRVSAPSPSA